MFGSAIRGRDRRLDRGPDRFLPWRSVIHVYTFTRSHHFGCRDRSHGFCLAFSGFGKAPWGQGAARAGWSGI